MVNGTGLAGQDSIHQAMGEAVGGSFDAIGYLEKLLLQQHGLGAETDLIDVGCGSGRLLSQLQASDIHSYLGIDISQELLDYAKQYICESNWLLKRVDDCRIPAADTSSDMVCMFSLITHLLHQESFMYFKEAARVLRQGGKLLVSFLEFRHPDLWPLFENSVDVVLGGERLDMFIDRDGLCLWAEYSGFKVVTIVDGEKPHIIIDREITFESGQKVTGMARLGPLGQSVAVLQKL